MAGSRDRDPADELGHPRPERGADVGQRARSVLDDIVQHRGDEHVRAAHPGALDQDLHGLEQVLQVRHAGLAPLVAVVVGGELHRCGDLGDHLGGQPPTEVRSSVGQVCQLVKSPSRRQPSRAGPAERRLVAADGVFALIAPSDAPTAVTDGEGEEDGEDWRRD